MATQQPIRATTQEFLEIADIDQDLVLLQDGSVALIIGVSAVNFGLLSEEEQEATIFAYAGLLNSLSFPLQIVILNKKMDISSYLEELNQAQARQTSPILRERIKKYHDFVKSVVKENRVLEKKFYLALPFSALELGAKGALGSLSGKKGLPFSKDYIFSRAKTSLFPKRDHLLRQLNRLGLRGAQLTTERLIELFYELYNPAVLGVENITDAEGYTQPLVQSPKEIPSQEKPGETTGKKTNETSVS